MLTFKHPEAATMDGLVARESVAGYTYPTGLTRGERPPRWFVEDLDCTLGRGPEGFAAACAALRAWDHAELGWFHVHRPDEAVLEAERTVGYSARVLGLWWSYCCRIVEVIDEAAPDGTRRFGFAYGTVGTHAERGEERFVVSLDGATGEVRGSIYAVSRPGRWFTFLGLPFARRAQRRFKPDSLAALAGAVRRRLPSPGAPSAPLTDG